MRQPGRVDPDAIVKLVSLKQRRVAFGPAAATKNAPDANRAAPFYSEVTPDGRVACPDTKEARVAHVLQQHKFTAGDLVYTDVTQASIRLLFSLSRLRFM